MEQKFFQIAPSPFPPSPAPHEESEDEEDLKVAETDPSGRFERYHICLGKGAYKEVFKAFDQEEGFEVAWNQLRLDNFSKKDVQRLISEIHILESLRNENIINLYHSWITKGKDGKDKVIFITELMTSGTLKSYLKKTKGVIKPKVLRNWCKQILAGLLYLHTRNPIIIHRDLKCENIFINGNSGQTKIGDLGLAVIKSRDHVSSVLGTPEFMAPELYDENYDEKVDVYAFGMMVLEIVSKEYPYKECTNQAQIYKKVSSGVKPNALQKIADPKTKSFIELCIEFDKKRRPSVAELLQHSFLKETSVSSQQNMLSDISSTSLSSTISDEISPTQSPKTHIVAEDNLMNEFEFKNLSVSSPPSGLITTDILSQQATVNVVAGMTTSSTAFSTSSFQQVVSPSPHYPNADFISSNNKEKKMSEGSILTAGGNEPIVGIVDADNHTFHITHHSLPSKQTATVIEIVGFPSENEVMLKMIYVGHNNMCEDIKFPFNLATDTATDVISEMVNEKLIEAEDEQDSRRKLEEIVRKALMVGKQAVIEFQQQQQQAHVQQQQDIRQRMFSNSSQVSYGERDGEIAACVTSDQMLWVQQQQQIQNAMPQDEQFIQYQNYIQHQQIQTQHIQTQQIIQQQQQAAPNRIKFNSLPRSSSSTSISESQQGLPGRSNTLPGSTLRPNLIPTSQPQNVSSSPPQQIRSPATVNANNYNGIRRISQSPSLQHQRQHQNTQQRTTSSMRLDETSFSSSGGISSIPGTPSSTSYAVNPLTGQLIALSPGDEYTVKQPLNPVPYQQQIYVNNGAVFRGYAAEKIIGENLIRQQQQQQQQHQQIPSTYINLESQHQQQGGLGLPYRPGVSSASSSESVDSSGSFHVGGGHGRQNSGGGGGQGMDFVDYMHRGGSQRNMGPPLQQQFGGVGGEFGYVRQIGQQQQILNENFGQQQQNVSLNEDYVMNVIGFNNGPRGSNSSINSGSEKVVHGSPQMIFEEQQQQILNSHIYQPGVSFHHQQQQQQYLPGISYHLPQILHQPSSLIPEQQQRYVHSASASSLDEIGTHRISPDLTGIATNELVGIGIKDN